MYSPKKASCINWQLPIIILKKLIISDMHHWVMYMYINFQQNQVNRLVIIVHTNLFPPKKASCINWQLPIVIFKKSTLSDMHHRKTYMYISFQQNRASRSVKTVHTNLFAKYCNMHIFATCNSNFKKSILSDMNHLIIHI